MHPALSIFRLSGTFLCLFWLLCPWILRAVDGEARAVGKVRITPLPVEVTSGNAGLFMGVGHFQDEANLSSLQYTTSDAIALAHLFVLELQLIPPGSAWLAINGKPATEETARQLAELRQAGIKETPPLKNHIIDTVDEIARSRQESDALLVFSFATHGFEKDGMVYIMPEDGRAKFIEDTGLKMESVKRAIRDSKATKRVLLLDACREIPHSRGSGGKMSRQFQEALKLASGMAVLSSCSSGQVSWESPSIGHGVFTYYIIEGLRGRAPHDRQTGFIHLGALSQYVAQATQEWSLGNKGVAQTPWFEGEIARSIPLAVAIENREHLASLDERKRTALDLLISARVADPESIRPEVVDAVAKALQEWTGDQLDDLLRQLEDLQDRQAFRRRNFLRYWRDISGAGPEKITPRSTAIPAMELAGVRPEFGQAFALNSLSLQLVWIKAGQFVLGSPETDPDRDVEEGPQTRIELSDGFWMSAYETSQNAYLKVTGENPSRYNNSLDLPVEQVNWQQAMQFCEKLTRAERQQGRLPEGYIYRLPTEAEWEYAARAGTSGTVYLDYDPYDRASVISELAWWADNSNLSSHLPGQKVPNAFGLYDMLGNVWEWCHDYYAPEYPGGSETNWTGPSEGRFRVIRGGGFRSKIKFIRCAHRFRDVPRAINSDLGFRIVLARPIANR